MNISSTTKKKATFSITGLLSTFVNVEKIVFLSPWKDYNKDKNGIAQLCLQSEIKFSH